MKNRKLIFTTIITMCFGLIFSSPVFAQAYEDYDDYDYDDYDYDDYDYDDYDYDDYDDYDDYSYGSYDVSGGTFLFDEQDLFTDEQDQEIASYLATLSSDYGIGIYIATMYDYTRYDSDLEKATIKFFEKNNLGLGSDASGLLLLLSMEDRSYYVDTHGYGRIAFNSSRRDSIIDAFKPDFRNNDWYNGTINYINAVYTYLDNDRENNVNYETAYIEKAAEETRNSFLLVGGIALIVALIFAFARLSHEKKRMKNVAFATEANSYIAESGVEFTEKNDIYKFSTSHTRTIQTSSRSGGGGGGHSGSGGHF